MLRDNSGCDMTGVLQVQGEAAPAPAAQAGPQQQVLQPPGARAPGTVQYSTVQYSTVQNIGAMFTGLCKQPVGSRVITESLFMWIHCLR